MAIGTSMVFQVGDEHTLTVISDEALDEGQVFRSAGNVPEQEAIYWEVLSVGANAVCECRVVGINQYLRAIM